MAPDPATFAEGSSLTVRTRYLSGPKHGNSESEYEDAAWPQRSLHRSARSFRCAVADGATETSFSGIWARLLVRAYCAGRLDPPRLAGEIASLGVRWRDEVGSAPLPWYAEQKLASGAYSSLLGITARQDGSWTAHAVGDSCVLQVRGGEIATAFPIERGADFSNRPHLISTNQGANGDIADRLMIHEGEWVSGDALYLMTDALAACTLAAVESGDPPWAALDDIARAPRSHFARWIDDLRSSGAMRNDDVTLLRVSLL